MDSNLFSLSKIPKYSTPFLNYYYRNITLTLGSSKFAVMGPLLVHEFAAFNQKHFISKFNNNNNNNNTFNHN